MELTPVQSSHIAAIGYLESDGVLLVRYRDGSLYARPGLNAVAYENLMRAPSKGGALAAWVGPSILIAKGVMPYEPEPSADHGHRDRKRVLRLPRMARCTSGSDPARACEARARAGTCRRPT